MINTKQFAVASISLAATSLLAPALAQTAAQSPEAAMKSEMKEADKDMGRVLKKLQDLGAKPLSTLIVEQARSQPSPATRAS